MVICHALTGSADVSDWWQPLIGPGRAFDTRTFFIICLNVLGSPYGTASPLTPNPDTPGETPYGPEFPRVTIRDTVRLHRLVLDRLGVESIQVVVGGSMGGMQALEWAFYGPDYVKSVVPIATSGRHSAWCISWSEAQRHAIWSDPCWLGGRYSKDKPPTMGLAAARMQALLTYRSRTSFESRFGRQVSPAKAAKEGKSSCEGPGAVTALAQHAKTPTNDQHLFSAQSYLRYQGEKFVNRFDANCYVAITYMMDTHDVARGRGSYPEVLKTLTQPALIIGVESDGLFTLDEQRELHKWMPQSELAVIQSAEGHDGFLLEFAQMDRILKTWLRKTLPDALKDTFEQSIAARHDDTDLAVSKTSTFGEAEADVMQW